MKIRQIAGSPIGVIRSQASLDEEGSETIRLTPKSLRYGEEIVHPLKQLGDRCKQWVGRSNRPRGAKFDDTNSKFLDELGEFIPNGWRSCFWPVPSPFFISSTKKPCLTSLEAKDLTIISPISDSP